MTVSPALEASPTPATPPRFVRGQWFDGRRSRARPVALALTPAPEGPGLLVQPLDEPQAAPLRLAHKQVGWPERWGAHRLPSLTLDLHEHGSVQIDDHDTWAALLGAAGGRASLAEHMQTRWRVFLTVAVLAVAGIFAFYRWGTPLAATQLTRFVPYSWEQSISEQALVQMDKSWLKPSKLPAARQAELRRGFDALLSHTAATAQHYRRYQPAYRLEFRSGMPANAFALPGGLIVMTDAIVKTTADAGLGDDALLGVLAHEIGHVAERHGTRLVVEQGVLNIGLGLALGDVASVMSTSAGLLTGLSYRRAHEREADCFAMRMMGAAQRPTAPMGELLLHLSRLHGAGGDDDTKDSPGAGSIFDDWLSTHPDTPARAERLRQGQGCG